MTDPAPEEAHLRTARSLVAACAGAPADEAIRLLQRAVAHFAAAAPDEAGQWEYAEACQQLGDLLRANGRLPEALQAYQEAVDAFEGVPGGAERSRICARAIVEGGHRLRATPAQRLHLLIAKYDRRVRQLEVVQGTERQRAEVEFHLATVLHRRERSEEALARYQAALRLFEQSADAELMCAECCQRLALLCHSALGDREAAKMWCRRAIALYADHEPEVDGVQVARRSCQNLYTALDKE